MEPIIKVNKLHKQFESNKSGKGFRGVLKGLVRPDKVKIDAVRDISFNVEKGERIAFIGPNGAGKSTTIKMLSGILYPTSGSLTVSGLNPQKDRKKLSYKIGTVFGQKSQLWPHLPASSTFRLLGRIYDLEDKVYATRLDELIERFKIASFFEQPVRKMSLGQRMRCEIVSSLLHSPEILFLDEPTIGLDVAAKAVIRDIVKEMSEQEATTVFLTSHDTGDMERVCDRVLVINQGELLIDNSIGELKSNYIKKKMITLLMKEESIEFEQDGIRIVETKPHRAKIEIDTTKLDVDFVITEALKKTRLRDITVEDPPMEEIVQEMYGRF